jgi:hypothetical protein
VTIEDGKVGIAHCERRWPLRARAEPAGAATGAWGRRHDRQAAAVGSGDARRLSDERADGVSSRHEQTDHDLRRGR